MYLGKALRSFPGHSKTESHCGERRVAKRRREGEEEHGVRQWRETHVATGLLNCATTPQFFVF